MTETLRTAYHEAGHAVAAVMLGLPLQYVTLRPRAPGVAAHCVFRDGVRTVPLRFEAVQLHAGPVAIARFVWISTGEDVLVEEYANGGALDAAALADLLADHDQADDLWEETQQWALNLLDRHWDVVDHVATDLADRKTVPAADIRAVAFGLSR